MRRQAKEDPEFGLRLLNFISHVISESMPRQIPDETNPGVSKQVFQLFIHPDEPYFEDIAQIHTYDIIYSRNMHSRKHYPTCSNTGRNESAVQERYG